MTDSETLTQVPNLARAALMCKVLLTVNSVGFADLDWHLGLSSYWS